MYVQDIQAKLGDDYEVEGFGSEIFVTRKGLKFARVVLKQACLMEGWNSSLTHPIVLEVTIKMFGQILRSNNKPVFCSDPEATVVIIKRLLETPEDMQPVGSYER